MNKYIFLLGAFSLDVKNVPLFLYIRIDKKRNFIKLDRLFILIKDFYLFLIIVLSINKTINKNTYNKILII